MPHTPHFTSLPWPTTDVHHYTGTAPVTRGTVTVSPTTTSPFTRSPNWPHPRDCHSPPGHHRVGSPCSCTSFTHNYEDPITRRRYVGKCCVQALSRSEAIFLLLCRARPRFLVSVPPVECSRARAPVSSEPVRLLPLPHRAASF